MNIGRLIRIKRQKLGYRVHDLVDNHISSGTISKIERNDPTVTESKIDYLMQKLNTNKKKLISELAELEKQENKNIKYLLQGAETIIDQFKQEGLEEAEFYLNSMSIDSAHEQYAKKHYLLAKIYRRQNKNDKAKIHLHKAANNDYGKQNIKASAYNDLGLLSHEANNMQEAMDYINQGLEICVPEGKRKYAYYSLLTNKALILEMLGQRNKANEILQTLWNNYHEIEKAYTKCQIHYIQSNIYIDNKKYDKAIKLLNKGIELARINDLNQMSFTLWTTLGRILIKKKEYEPAEKCLTIAIKLGGKTENQKPIIKTHIQLGSLYIKLSKWNKAYDNIQQALRLSIQYNDVLKKINSRIILSKYFLAQKIYEDAIIPLNEALELSEKHNYLEKQYLILKQLTSIYKIIDSNKFEEVLGKYCEIKAILDEKGYSIIHK